MNRISLPSIQCEWDPDKGKAAFVGEGCMKPATTVVGRGKNWHLCDSCAALPRFARYKVRVPLRGRQG